MIKLSLERINAKLPYEVREAVTDEFDSTVAALKDKP